jgi:hypothetical protein
MMNKENRKRRHEDDDTASYDSDEELYYMDDKADGHLMIVGLDKPTDDKKSCCREYVSCGAHVQVNDLLRLVPGNYAVGKQGRGVKLVKILDGTETCTVGHVPKKYENLPKVKANLYQFVQVCHIGRYADSKRMRKLDRKHHGIASVSFLNDIPKFE